MLLCPRYSPSKNTGAGRHFLLQGIFLTRDQTHISLSLLHWQVDSLPLATFGKQGRMWGKKKSHQVGTCIPGRDLKGREVPHGWTFTLGSKQVKPQFWHPIPGILHRQKKPPRLLGNSLRQTDRRRLDSTHKEHMCAGSLTVRAKRATRSDGCHFTAFPNPNRQTPWPPQSTPQTSVRSGQRLGLAMQRQTGGPEV